MLESAIAGGYAESATARPPICDEGELPAEFRVAGPGARQSLAQRADRPRTSSTGIFTVTRSGRTSGGGRDWRHEAATRPVRLRESRRIERDLIVLPELSDKPAGLIVTDLSISSPHDLLDRTVAINRSKRGFYAQTLEIFDVPSILGVERM